MRKKAIKEPAIEAAKTDAGSTITVDLDGKAYELSFNIRDLAAAERHFRQQGHNVNILLSLPEQALDGVRSSFPCLVHRSRPDLTFEQAQELVTLNSAYPIALAISQAFDGANRRA